MARECRKCGSVIPNRMIIDGFVKVLCNRKFCLTCSPYKKHNTKPDDPLRPNKRPSCYSEWGDDEKIKNMLSVLKRGLTRKRQLIEMAGGECIKCGYKGCERALCFHHREPTKKMFGLSLNNLWSKSWDVVVNEFNKCDMLCLNCHAEIETEKEGQKETNYRKWLKIE